MTGVMMLKIQLCITGINYIFKYIKTYNYFNLQQYDSFLLYFGSNKWFRSKTLQNLTDPKLLNIVVNVV